MSQVYQAEYVALAEDDLSKLQALDKTIKHLHNRLVEKQNRIYSISGTDTSNTKVQTSRTNKLENAVIEIQTLREQLLDAVIRKNTLEHERKDILQEMPLRLRNIVECKIYGENLMQLGISFREVKAVTKEALMMYGQLLEQKTE